MARTGVVSTRSHCKICTSQCGIVVEVQDDQVVKVRGDRDHPLSKGYTCPKGRALGQLHHHPDAIVRPLMKKNGALVPVDWESCLDDVATRLKAIVDEHGPNAVGFYFGSGLGMDASGYRLADCFYKALGTPPKFSPLTIDGACKVLVSSLVGGFPGLNAKTDNDHADMLIYIGVNPMVSHGHNTGMFNPPVSIRGVAGRGELWTIDPLRTQTAQFSTRHLAPWPGKDYAILAWLVREVIDGGPFKPAQPITGLDTLRAELDGFERATAAAISGVSEQDLDDLLQAIRRKGRVVVETGTGVSMTSSANLTQWFAWVLMILTGQMNRRGGAWFHPGFILQYDSFELPLLDNPFTPGPPTMPEVTGLIGEWPCAALAGEIDAGNIRALVNFGGSILRSFPDINGLAPALEKLEVNVDFEIIENETTRLSTHVLPTKGQLERPEISFWDTLCGSLSMLYNPAVTAPVEERRSAWWLIAEIMRRMELAVPDFVPETADTEAADQTMLASLMAGARCTFEELAAAGQVTQPLELPGAWVDRHIERIGGWRLAPDQLVELWHATRREDEAALKQPRPLCFTPRRQRRKLNASLSFLGSPADIILNPEDAAARGIRDGQRVKATTPRGEIVLTANVSDTMRVGVVSIPHGHEHANVNCLTSVRHVDPMTGMVRYSGIPVELEGLDDPVERRQADC